MDKMKIYLFIGLMTSIFFFHKKEEWPYFIVNIFLWGFMLPIAIICRLFFGWMAVLEQ